MKDLDLLEATRLSIYFEELAAHQYRQRKEMENKTRAASPSQAEVVEFELGNAEEYDDPDWWKEED